MRGGDAVARVAGKTKAVALVKRKYRPNATERPNLP